MSESQRVVYSGGPGTCTLLGVVFITLKLTGYVSWPWLWVLAPLWIPWALVLVFLLVCVVVLGIAFFCGMFES